MKNDALSSKAAAWSAATMNQEIPINNACAWSTSSIKQEVPTNNAFAWSPASVKQEIPTNSGSWSTTIKQEVFEDQADRRNKLTAHQNAHESAVWPAYNYTFARHQHEE